jgi:electron transport complex protein RnfB
MERACTGCGACIEICPTGALALVEEAPTLRTWRWTKPELVAA